MKITKKELLRRLNEKGYGLTEGRWPEAVVCAAVETVGSEVLEEPEPPKLPERVLVDEYGRVYYEDGALIVDIDQWRAWLREAGLRYNAKGKVLAALERLEREGVISRVSVARISAAYDKERA